MLLNKRDRIGIQDQKIQWLKEKGQENKQRSTQKTENWATSQQQEVNTTGDTIGAGTA